MKKVKHNLGALKNNVKQKVEALKNKYGVAIPLAGVLTFGTAGYIAQKDIMKTQTELPSNTSKEMTPQEKSDAILTSVLIMMEGCTLNAYTDDIGVWTYGIGCTRTIDGRAVKKGDTLQSNEEAFEVSNHHIRERIDYVFDYIKRDLTPEQKAAIKSFAYNCGAGTLVKTDGELTKLGKAINEGNDDFVIREMLTYNKAGGSFMKGLFFRRVLEAYIYQGLVPLDELQKCIIGGVYNASYNREMKDIFGLKEVKSRIRGKKGKVRLKVKETYNDVAITNPEVAKKMLEICQTPQQGKISEKYAEFHMGEKIAEFLPERFVIPNTITFNDALLADVNQDEQCKPSTLKLKENKQVASIAPDFGALISKIRKFKNPSK